MTRRSDIADEFWRLLDAACDGELDPADQARLEAYLSDNPDAHQAFVEHIRVRSHVRLWWKGERSRQAGLDRVAGGGRRHEDQHGCGMMNDESLRASPTPVAPVHHSSFTIHHSFAGGILVSYLLAAIILGAAALNAWWWQSSVKHDVAGVADGALADDSERLPLGRITVAMGCRVASGDSTPADSGNSATVFRGRKFALERGLLEIVYRSGWQIILQGPATFEVDADNGGLLTAGKLTARSGGDRSSPLVLRTPAATLVGTAGEMGVEVRQPRTCRVCVFDGHAELRAGGGTGHPVERLHEHQSVEAVQVAGREIIRPVSQPEFAAGFARRILRTVFPKMSGPEEQLARVWLKSIGPDFTEGRLIAVGSGKDVELSAGQPTLRVREGSGGVTFTTHQTFEVADVALDTALVRGWFIAQGRVSAVRFNGVSLAGLVPGNGKPGDGSGGFVVGKELVRQVNTLELDFTPAAPLSPQNNGLMWLRLRVAGIRLPGQQAPPIPAPRPRPPDTTFRNKPLF